MSKKVKIILVVAIIAVVAYFLLFKSGKNATTAYDGNQGNGISFENSHNFTEEQVKKLQQKLREWIDYIISKKWDCVVNKNAEKLVDDSLYQISLSAKKNPELYANMSFKTWEDLKEVAAETGIYDEALEYSKTAL